MNAIFSKTMQDTETKLLTVYSLKVRKFKHGKQLSINIWFVYEAKNLIYLCMNAIFN